jgi:hypothetical protein
MIMKMFFRRGIAVVEYSAAGTKRETQSSNAKTEEKLVKKFSPPYTYLLGRTTISGISVPATDEGCGPPWTQRANAFLSNNSSAERVGKLKGSLGTADGTVIRTRSRSSGPAMMREGSYT